MNPTRRFLCLGSILLFLLSLGSSSVVASDAVKLALRFRQGQILRYTYTEKLTYSPPTAFMGVGAYVLEAKVDYKLKVRTVEDDGTARVKLQFERIAILRDGNQVADLTVFPKDGNNVSATIKPNGETTFYKKVYVAVNKGDQLEYRISKGGGMMATNTKSSVGSETYILAADLAEDEGIIRIGVPPTRNVESPDHAKLCEFKVDLTPRKLFEFLTLPTVQLAQGQTFSIPHKYLGQGQLSYLGQADDAGFRGSQVKLEITPWTGDSEGATGLQPDLSGSLTYLIEPSGKLVRAKGNLRTTILISGVGPQAADTHFDLSVRK